MSTASVEVQSHFLPAERAEAEELRRETETVAASEAPLLLDEHPEFTVILNGQRQIVYANRAARDMLAERDDRLLGMRFGEAFGCVHFCEGPGGCGTGSFCRLCGAATGMAEALKGEAYGDECLMRRKRSDEPGEREESLDLLVWIRPLKLRGLELLLVAARDISTRKRHEVLERVFYHDLANTATGIMSLLRLIPSQPGESGGAYLELLRAAAAQLAEEIASHRALKAAEDDELSVEPVVVDGHKLLEEAIAFFAYHLHGKQVSLAVESGSEHPLVQTDPALLRRILINMVKNALEAAEGGETIALSCRLVERRAVFSVRNRAVMSESTRKRVFERSFSTKGPGRGVGTYGMRLLGERYLRGRVGFSSSESEGTVFKLSLPLVFPPAPPFGAGGSRP